MAIFNRQKKKGEGMSPVKAGAIAAAIPPAMTGDMPEPFFLLRLKIAIRERPSGSGRR